MFCKNCGQALNDNQAICLNCGVKVGDGTNFCPNCGAQTAPNADVCLNCGVALKKAGANGQYLNGQDKTVLGIIAIFLGGLGIHNFMLGEAKKGIIKIVFSLCFGIGAILGLIDAIKIFTDKYVVDPEKFF